MKKAQVTKLKELLEQYRSSQGEPRHDALIMLLGYLAACLDGVK